VRAWLDAVLDAEDLLEEIDFEVSKSKLEAESQSSTNKVWNFFNASSSSFDKEIETKMQEVLENLEYLSIKKDILDLKKCHQHLCLLILLSMAEMLIRRLSMIG